MSAALDQYGGNPTGGVFERTGAFRTVRKGPRFLFATPEGNAFWLKACYGIDVTDGGQTFVDALQAKYRQHPSYATWGYWFAFVSQAVRYLRQWGFNALGEYSSNYAWPIESYGRGQTNPEKMPFIQIINAAHYGKLQFGVKDVMHGVDEAVTPGLWRADGFPDVFDPAFARAAGDMIGAVNNPWLLGTSTDDRDYLFGFGPSHDFGGWHNHLGWQAAATRPTQDANPKLWIGNKRGISYTDKTVYTKLALRDSLRDKYRTLDQLNASWGSKYTTWDSDGKPWPTGRGLLDESGRSPWLGKDFYLAKDAHPAVRADLDAFVATIAERYFSVMAGTLRAKRPNHLVFGPDPISPQAHPEILKAAGRWCDVVQFSGDGGEAGFHRGYSLVKKPFFVWTTFMAQADSPLAGKKGWSGDFPTQEARGLAYAKNLKRMATFRAEDGTYPCVGIDWWAYCDKVTGGESNNFGLVTVRDNPYDGKAARVARSTDPWGNPTGAEPRNFGDFLTAVTAPHDWVFDVFSEASVDTGNGQRTRLNGLPATALLLAALPQTQAGPVNRRGFLQRVMGLAALHGK